MRFRMRFQIKKANFKHEPKMQIKLQLKSPLNNFERLETLLKRLQSPLGGTQKKKKSADYRLVSLWVSSFSLSRSLSRLACAPNRTGRARKAFGLCQSPFTEYHSLNSIPTLDGASKGV